VFTGLIADIGSVAAVRRTAGGARLRIATQLDRSKLAQGSSLAVDGVCLTAEALGPGWVEADLSLETLRRTTLDTVAIGAAVNLELALALGEPLGGHLVQGHVDGVGKLVARREAGDGWELEYEVPEGLSGQVVEKGSIAVDGVSLTVAGLHGARVTVAIIPHTAARTTLTQKAVGDRVNVETDVLGKYVERALSRMGLALSVGLALGCPGSSSGPAPANDGAGGNDPGTTYPAAALTVQEGIDLATFQAEAAADPELAAVASGLAIGLAGKLQDSDGRRVVWGEAEGKLTALLHCDGDECVAVRQVLTGGVPSWTDAAGKTVTTRTVGRPVLLKDLEGHELKNHTTLAGHLQARGFHTQLDPDALPEYTYASRRFVALNTFGALFGTGLSELTAWATQSGGFDEVIEVAYAREEDVAEVLGSSDALDVVVWLTQSVREMKKGDGSSWETVGVTVNRGGFGERTLDRNELGEIASGNLAGGPGVLVLVASQSYGDGSTAEPGQGSIWVKLDGLAPILIGVEGKVDIAEAVAGVKTLLREWSGGATLEAALAKAKGSLEAASLRSNAPGQSRLPASSAAILASAPIAFKKAQLTVPFTAVPYCGSPATPGPEDMATAWAYVDFAAGSFTGHRVGAGDQGETWLQGVVTGFAIGDRVYLEAWGDLEAAFQGFHGFAATTIESLTTDDATGVVSIGFKGLPAETHTTPYRNDLGATCALSNPVVSTITGHPGTLVLTP
jgi:riboflavin synthase